MTPAKSRLAQAAMAKRDTKVGELCEELGVTRQTLYRFVGPTGELRADGSKLLKRKGQNARKEQETKDRALIGRLAWSQDDPKQTCCRIALACIRRAGLRRLPDRARHARDACRFWRRPDLRIPVSATGFAS
jgi:hypothetical protein